MTPREHKEDHNPFFDALSKDLSLLARIFKIHDVEEFLGNIVLAHAKLKEAHHGCRLKPHKTSHAPLIDLHLAITKDACKELLKTLNTHFPTLTACDTTTTLTLINEEPAHIIAMNPEVIQKYMLPPIARYLSRNQRTYSKLLHQFDEYLSEYKISSKRCTIIEDALLQIIENDLHPKETQWAVTRFFKSLTKIGSTPLTQSIKFHCQKNPENPHFIDLSAEINSELAEDIENYFNKLKPGATRTEYSSSAIKITINNHAFFTEKFEKDLKNVLKAYSPETIAHYRKQSPSEFTGLKKIFMSQFSAPRM